MVDVTDTKILGIFAMIDVNDVKFLEGLL